MDIEQICRVLTQARNRKDFEASGVILTLLDELGIEILDCDRDLYWWNRTTGEKVFVETSRYHSTQAFTPKSEPPTLAELSEYDLLTHRDIARQNKKWDEADTIRAEIERRGLKVIDAKQGSKLIRK